MQNYFLCRVKITLIHNSFPIVWINHFGAKPDEVDEFAKITTCSKKSLTHNYFSDFSSVKKLKFNAKEHRKNVPGSTLLFLVQIKTKPQPIHAARMLYCDSLY